MTLPFADARILANGARASALEIAKALSVAAKGGYTLKRDGEIVGGLGISGGSPDEDQKICEDVVRAAGFELDFPEWAGTAARRPH